jgi:purine-binding chemotaxis protein CheW
MEKQQMSNMTEYEKNSAENQFVTFMLGSEIYGVKVTNVQEIIGMTPVTHVPNSPVFMRGVINLRGTVVPVIDMRLFFNMGEKKYDAFTVIIIVETNNRPVGMIVDSVSDVANVPVSTIQETPHFTSNIKTDYIEGIGRIGDSLIIILEVGKIMSSEIMAVAGEHGSLPGVSDGEPLSMSAASTL